MNAQENIIRELLKVLGETTRLLREHASVLERRPDVKSVSTRCEVVYYKSGSMIEGFVDAELNDGTGLSWCLDVTWSDNSFHVEATLDRSSKGGSETLQRLHVPEMYNVNEFCKVLSSATRALLALNPV